MENDVFKSEDVLQIIPNEELKKLRDLFKIDWPSHVHIYNFLDTVTRWKQNKKFENYITVYGFNGNWEDGTFVAVVEMYFYNIVLYTLDKSLSKIQDALRKTKIINWEKRIIFPSMRIEFKEPLENVNMELADSFMLNLPSYIWWLPKEKALQYEWTIPSGYFISELKISHADILNERWAHKRPGSENYVSKLIEINGGVGLFSKETGELCAWVIKNYLGALGILQVAENHRRKGFGYLITKIFSKILAEDGLDIIGCVVLANTISQNMFIKLGFEKIIAVTWLYNSE